MQGIKQSMNNIESTYSKYQTNMSDSENFSEYGEFK